MTEEFTVTVHVEPDASPETLQALSDMMKCLIKAIENGEIGIDHGKGTDVNAVALIKDGKVVAEFCQHFPYTTLINGFCEECGLPAPPIT